MLSFVKINVRPTLYAFKRNQQYKQILVELKTINELF